MHRAEAMIVDPMLPGRGAAYGNNVGQPITDRTRECTTPRMPGG